MFLRKTSHLPSYSFTVYLKPCIVVVYLSSCRNCDLTACGTSSKWQNSLPFWDCIQSSYVFKSRFLIANEISGNIHRTSLVRFCPCHRWLHLLNHHKCFYCLRIQYYLGNSCTDLLLWFTWYVACKLIIKCFFFLQWIHVSVFEECRSIVWRDLFLISQLIRLS